MENKFTIKLKIDLSEFKGALEVMDFGVTKMFLICLHQQRHLNKRPRFKQLLN